MVLPTDIILAEQPAPLLHELSYLGYKEIMTIAPITSIAPELTASCKLRQAALFTTHTQQLRQQIQSARDRGMFTIARASTEEHLLFLCEKTSVHLVYGMEYLFTRDSLHYRKSGLNQVICSHAKEQHIMFGFSFEEFLKSNPKSLILGKLMQNLSIAKKSKVPYFVGSFATQLSSLRNSSDLRAFVEILGGDSKITL